MRSLAQLLLTVLLNASWQIAVVTLFAICCSWLLRGTAAWCRHSVWVAAIVISLCLPIISGLNALESSPVPKQPKQNLTLIEPEQSVTSPASLQEIALTVPAIAPVQMAKVGPARQAGWISPISLNRNLAAVLVAFYAFFLVYKAKDVAAVMALRTDDFHTITPDGKVNARADMEAYTQRFLKRIDHFISEDFQLGTIEVQGDLASADVTQKIRFVCSAFRVGPCIKSKPVWCSARLGRRPPKAGRCTE